MSADEFASSGIGIAQLEGTINMMLKAASGMNLKPGLSYARNPSGGWPRTDNNSSSKTSSSTTGKDDKKKPERKVRVLRV